jgi:hypothetical protein
MADPADVALLPRVLIREEGAIRLALWALGRRGRGIRLALGVGHAMPKRWGATASSHGQDAILKGHAAYVQK